MKKQRNSNYNKGLRYYEIGDIDKSLIYLEKSISESLKNSAALNLKGLLLYLRGNLKDAIATWRINYEFNDDNIAKGYINDAKKDEVRLGYYEKAEVLLKQLRIEETLECLHKCRKSDFNAIKVNIALGICYFKKGNYEESSVYISKALEIDKNNPTCINIAKELKEYTDINLLGVGRDYRKIIISFAIIVILVLGGVSIYKLQRKNDVNPQENIVNIDNNPQVYEENSIKDEYIEKVNIEEFEVALENKDYNKLYDLVDKLKSEEINGKEKALYVNAIGELKDDGSKFFYEDGMKLYNNKDYVNAKNQLNKAYEYGKTSYLYPHILFFNGVVREKVGDKDSIKYYSEYIDNASKDDDTYVEESLYRLALLYRDEDLEYSNFYAKKLAENYPKSIYNNDVIKGILNLNN